MSARRPWNLSIFRGKGDRSAVAVLFLVFFGANWPLLVNRVSEQWDGEIFFRPFYSEVATLARAGRLLFWNPFCNAGSPDFAEPQIGAFSPLTLLFGLVAGPGPLGFHLYWLAIWLLGGLGMYVLARSLSAPPWGALVTALSVVFCGFYIGHAEHLSAVYSFSFVPWVLWRVRAALTQRNPWAACQAGALWGLSALAGNPAVHIPAALFIGFVALAWLPTVAPSEPPWARWRSYALTMALLAFVGVLVLAPAYVSFRYEVAGYSHRSLPLPRATALTGKFGWSWLTSLASPFLVSLSDTMPAWDEFDISMREIYFGAAVPVLAILTLWRQRADWRTWVVFSTGLLFLGVSLGSLLPLRAWLYDLVPPTRFFRHAPMFRGFFILAVAMLAAPASAFVDARCRGNARICDGFRALAVVAGSVALLAVGSCVGLYFVLGDEIRAQLSTGAICHLGFVWGGLTVLCAAAARRREVRRFLPGALVTLTVLDLTTALFLTRRVVYQDKPSFVATGPVQPLDEPGPGGFDRLRSDPSNANIHSRQPVFESYTAMRNPLQERWATDDQLCPYVLGSQRVWFAAGLPTVPATAEAYQAFEERARATRTLPVVRQTRDGLLTAGNSPLSTTDRAAIASAPAAQPVDCLVLACHANDLALRVTCPRDGFLLVTDRWSRSWQATVNGRPVPVDGGDFLFRLVPVTAGSNLVEMRFHVPWIYALIVVSWGTLAMVGSTTVFAWWKRLRSRKCTLTPRDRFRPSPVETAVAVGV